MAKKVYTLLRTSATRGEQAADVRVFNNLLDAKATMAKEFIAELNDWQQWCDPDCLMKECDEENARSIYEMGDYSYNHIDWIVEEKEVL